MGTWIDPEVHDFISFRTKYLATQVELEAEKNTPTDLYENLVGVFFLSFQLDLCGEISSPERRAVV